MKVTLWGTRGSLPTPGRRHVAYGGNTSCVAVQGRTERCSCSMPAPASVGWARRSAAVQRVDILLTHLHMDHIQGLGFFAPLYRAGLEVNIWGPVSTKLSLRTRLMRYLSPPLFPVRLSELPCALTLHEVPAMRSHRRISRRRRAGLPSGCDRGLPDHGCARQGGRRTCPITSPRSARDRFRRCRASGLRVACSPKVRIC